MVLQNYQNFIEMTSNMIYIVALGGGFKCPRKIHLNTQWGEDARPLLPVDQLTLSESNQEADSAPPNFQTFLWPWYWLHS